MSNDAITLPELVAAVRRIESNTDNKGHAFRPIAAEDVPLLESANEEQEIWSLRCWGCSFEDDRPVDPVGSPGGQTWGDRAHERHAAWSTARSWLSAFDEINARWVSK